MAGTDDPDSIKELLIKDVKTLDMLIWKYTAFMNNVVYALFPGLEPRDISEVAIYKAIRELKDKAK